MISPVAYRLTAMHTGTYFFREIYQRITGLNPDWYAPHAHLFCEPLGHEDKYTEMLESGLPVIVNVRDHAKSLATYHKRRGIHMKGYGPDEHMRSLERLSGLLSHPRVFAFDVDTNDREAMLRSVPWGAPVDEAALVRVAREWPLVNSSQEVAA